MSWFWKTIAGLQDALVAPSFGAPGYRVRRRLWDDPDLALDLRGRAYVVTGANAGLGRATTEALVARGGAVHMVCRSEDRGRAAREDIAAAHDAADRVRLHLADLGDLAAVAALADELAAALPEGLDGLVHNAGALLHEATFTAQGLEVTFATHVAGPFLLTDRLAPALAEAATRRAGRSRVVWVASGGMYTRKLRVAELRRGPDPYDGLAAYAQAKRAQVLLAHRWHERLAPDGVTVASMHPGWADTGGVRRSLPRFRRVTRAILRDAAQGADTAVWLAASPEAADADGGFFLDRQRRREHIPLGRTRSTAEEVDALWELCEQVTSRAT